MRNLLLACCLVLLAVSPSLAKDNMSSYCVCATPMQLQSIRAGDQPGNTYAISSGFCKPSGNNTFQEKTVHFSNILDKSGNTVIIQATYVSTTLSGDTINYAANGSYDVRGGVIQTGMVTWTLTGGTGKFANVTGEGTCSAVGDMNKTVSFSCGGAYTL